MKLGITISPTANGDKTYLQVISEDQFSVNLVLIVDDVTVNDTREN